MVPPVLEMPKIAPRVRDGVSLPGGPLRLNLGGAGEGFLSGKVPGFLIVDLRDVPDTDVISDVSDLSLFADGSVQEIYASNVLEHFPIPQTVPVLKEWRRVLVPKGKLWVSVPDFNAVLRLVPKLGLTTWIEYLLWGDQKSPLNYHYINFTFGSLSKRLMEAGFSDVKRLVDLPYGIKDASKHIDNLEFKQISLNVEVTN